MARTEKSVVISADLCRSRIVPARKKEIQNFRRLKRMLHGKSKRKALVFLENWIFRK